MCRQRGLCGRFQQTLKGPLIKGASGPAREVTTAAAAAGSPGVKAIGGTISGTKAAVFPITGTRATILAAGLATGTSAVAATSVAATAAITAAATSSSVAATATAAGSTTTATSAATTTGLSLVDAKGATHQLSALQPVNGPCLHFVIGHFHKGKASLATSVPLEREGAVHDVAVARKKFNDILLLSAEGKIADKDAHERGWGNRYGCRETNRFQTSID